TLRPRGGGVGRGDREAGGLCGPGGDVGVGVDLVEDRGGGTRVGVGVGRALEVEVEEVGGRESWVLECWVGRQVRGRDLFVERDGDGDEAAGVVGAGVVRG